jgi:hypothetical protein
VRTRANCSVLPDPEQSREYCSIAASLQATLRSSDRWLANSLCRGRTLGCQRSKKITTRGAVHSIPLLRAIETYDGITLMSFDVTKDAIQRSLAGANGLALQLPFPKISESMGNHDSKIVDADSVD